MHISWLFSAEMKICSSPIVTLYLSLKNSFQQYAIDIVAYHESQIQAETTELSEQVANAIARWKNADVAKNYKKWKSNRHQELWKALN